ncbi:hypothetical protein CRYUN_Cryun02cG0071000 [Craigia yunnanensis]
MIATVSSSSLDVGMVPNGSAMTDISNPHGRGDGVNTSDDAAFISGQRSEGAEVQREEKEQKIREDDSLRLQKSLRRDAT